MHIVVKELVYGQFFKNKSYIIDNILHYLVYAIYR
jgi:hypothetical protein